MPNHLNDSHGASASALGDVNKVTHFVGSTANQTSDGISWFDFIAIPKMDNLTDVLTIGCSLAVIFGGLVPYIPQYFKIKSSGSSDGFSTYVCLTLLLANILRIAFWFGHRFELPLLIQSFVMIAGMMVLMEICIRVRNRTTAYVIPSVRATQQPRRSLIVTAPSSPPPGVGESALLPFAAASSPSISVDDDNHHQSIKNQSHVPSSTSPEMIKPYHQQESADIGQLSSSGTVEHLSDAPHSSYSYSSVPLQGNNAIDSNININSIRDNESPILKNIHIEPEQAAGSESHQFPLPSPIGHSYANGYLSARRHKKSALVKWLNSHYFWDWDDLFSYVKFLSCFTLALGMITYLLLENNLYIETLGFVALFTEALLGMPQLIRNFEKKSTLGMSVHMVIMWLSGDLFKTLYFILRKAPAQFIVCGSIQVIVDVLILSQVFWYKRPRVSYSKLPKIT